MIRELADSLLPRGAPDAERALTVLALTLWGEARGTTLAAQRGVAQVIANRVAHPRWWGSTVTGVCLKKWQFTCWVAGDPNRAKLATPVSSDGWPPWERACQVAAETMIGYLERDPDLDDATHYFSAPLVRPPSAWGKNPRLCKKIGGLSFYAVEKL